MSLDVCGKRRMQLRSDEGGQRCTMAPGHTGGCWQRTEPISPAEVRERRAVYLARWANNKGRAP